MSGVVAELDRLSGGDSGIRTQLAGYCVAGLAQGGACAMLIPVLRNIFDGNPSGAWPAVAGIAGLVAVFAVVLWVTDSYGQRVGVRTSAALLRRIGDKVLELPLGWFHGRRTAEMMTVLDSVRTVSLLPGMVLQQMTMAVTAPLVIVVVTAFIDPLIAIAFVALALPAAWCLRWIRAASHGDDDSADEVTARLLEFAQAQQVLRASGRLTEGWDVLGAAFEADRAYALTKLRREARPLNTYVAIIQCALAVVLIVVAARALGSLPAADAIAVSVLAVRFVDPLSSAGGFATGLGLADRATAAIATVLDAPTLPVGTRTEVEDPAGGVEFDCVTFSYYAGDPVLDGLSLRLPAGSTTALVGPSGSGKSTAATLLARFYDVDAGAIRVGGTDVRELTPQTLMRQVATVFQDVYLFDGSVADNICIARPDAGDDQIRDVIDRANLRATIDALPRGVDTPVGERGRLLSGGERQRVSLARALLADAPVLILDEATASVDAQTEQAIGQAIASLTRTTVLVIAHRLSTVVSADRIAVLDGGRIVQEGTHAQLLAEGGRYAEFCAALDEAAHWRIA